MIVNHESKKYSPAYMQKVREYIEIFDVKSLRVRYLNALKEIERLQGKDVQVLTNEIVEWATQTFGERQQSVIPVVNHLKKEVDELLEALKSGGDYKDEFADCFMLLLESANSKKINVNELVNLTRSKLEKNKKRKWGLPNSDGIIEHIQ